MKLYESNWQENTESLSALCRRYFIDKGDFPVEEAPWHAGFPLHETLGYCRVYEERLGYLRWMEFRMLEIGCADVRFPLGSTRVWRAYFPRAEIYQLDNFRDWRHDPESLARGVNDFGVHCFVGDQGNREDMLSLLQQMEGQKFHVIIDDGSHYPTDIKTSLECLWGGLANGGWYFIEDIGRGLEKFGHENEEIIEWLRCHPVYGPDLITIRPAPTAKKSEIYIAILRKWEK